MNSEYVLLLISLLFILIVKICLHFWKFMRLYQKLPSCHLDVRLSYLLSTGSSPKDVPLTSYLFQAITDRVEKHFDSGMLLIWMYGPLLIVYNKEFVKALCSSPDAIEKLFSYRILKDLLGDGILTSSAAKWKHFCKVMNPIFRLGTLRDKVPMYNKYASVLIKKMKEDLGNPDKSLHKSLKECTICIAFELVLGEEFCGEKNKSKLVAVQDAIEKIEQFAVYRCTRPWLYWKSLLPLFPEGRKQTQNYKFVDDFAMEAILKIKNNILSQSSHKSISEDSRRNGTPIANIFLQQHLKDPTFTMEDVLAEVKTFATAGSDTVYNGIMWSLFLLGHHPEIQEKAYEEIKSVVGNEVLYEDIAKLRYLDSIVKETLRLFPPLPIYGRRLSNDIQCGKHLVPKDTNILFIPYMLHRNPNYYSDPEKFNPDRFDESAEVRQGTYIPFAEGYRQCMGKRYAMTEMKILLVYILRNFRVTSLDKMEDIKLKWKMVLSPCKPLSFQVSFRNTQCEGSVNE